MFCWSNIEWFMSWKESLSAPHLTLSVLCIGFYSLATIPVSISIILPSFALPLSFGWPLCPFPSHLSWGSTPGVGHILHKILLTNWNHMKPTLGKFIRSLKDELVSSITQAHGLLTTDRLGILGFMQIPPIRTNVWKIHNRAQVGTHIEIKKIFMWQPVRMIIYELNEEAINWMRIRNHISESIPWDWWGTDADPTRH